MNTWNNVNCIQTLRPRVLELEYGIFRGYVDVQERCPGNAASKIHYCRNVCRSRDLAERQAMELAEHLKRIAKVSGATSRLLRDSLSDVYAGRQELDTVPESLLRRDTGKPAVVKKRHLRIVA